jgi:hypothetical protein
MIDRFELKSWTVADRISVAVVFGAIAVIILRWEAGAIGSIQPSGIPYVSLIAAAGTGDCGEHCSPGRGGLSGDPATGMPHPW